MPPGDRPPPRHAPPEQQLHLPPASPGAPSSPAARTHGYVRRPPASTPLHVFGARLGRQRPPSSTQGPPCPVPLAPPASGIGPGAPEPAPPPPLAIGRLPRPPQRPRIRPLERPPATPSLLRLQGRAGGARGRRRPPARASPRPGAGPWPPGARLHQRAPP